MNSKECVATIILVVVVNFTRGASNGDIRLVGGQTPFAGRVEVFYNDRWGAVCTSDESWGWDEAEVTCKQLGHPGAMFHSVEMTNVYASVRELDCDGDEESLSGCVPEDGWQLKDASSSSEACSSLATVTCYFSGYIGCFEDCITEPFCSPDFKKIPSNIGTIQECLDICRNQNYLSAALSGGDTCSCGHDFQLTSEENRDCSIECAGDSSQACGGREKWIFFTYKKFGVFSTSVGECGGELSTSRGVIYSPGFPGSYSPSINCSWTVSMPEDSSTSGGDIVIEFELGMLELNSGDQLALTDSRGAKKLFPQETTTTASLPFLFNLTSPVIVDFLSSDSNLGFVLHYRAFETGPRCEKLPGLDNGEFMPIWSVYYPGDFVYVHCHSGFMPSVNEIVCLKNWTWSGHPYCVVLPPETPELITTTQSTANASGNGSREEGANSQDSATNAGVADGVVVAVLLVLAGLVAFLYVYRRNKLKVKGKGIKYVKSVEGIYETPSVSEKNPYMGLNMTDIKSDIAESEKENVDQGQLYESITYSSAQGNIYS